MSDFPDPALLVPLVFALGVLPVAVVMLTSYAKIVVVLSLLRNALGLQQVPPALVLNGLALLLTWYVMYPVGLQVAKDLQLDLPPGSRAPALTVVQVVSGAREPLRAFLDRHASLRERRFFQDASRRLLGAEAASATDDRDFLVLVPAFSVSQLTEAFLAGVLVMLPFLVIDLVVAHVLMALGMQMLSPAMVSLPVKLLLFVLLDGWSRLAHALVLGYR